ncbi:hypothetical protein Q9S36_40450 [Microbacterium sp. ARD31]|uniref:hypothetical protein n=1 Tax=Microbacterium sp. ARD31 TaxID=2962576 RepID=UPI0028811801|nr:hypothetical protein [Microbacterium sp. ARD31]MDT0186474.1 hypothetical protein [Microbacterium sp. ARD31]
MPHEASTAPDVVRIHAFIISWNGRAEAAMKIAHEISEHVDELTVIHSDPSGVAPAGTRGWEIVPDSYFYGMKFKRSLELFGSDVMLQVQADASCDDWAALVAAARRAFTVSANVAVWAPDVNFTPWPARLTTLNTAAGPLRHVAIIDGIVWALSAEVCERLTAFDYRANNVGWGIDWAAAAFALATGRDVLVDISIHVEHPMTRGYDTSDATAQMDAFLDDLDQREQAMRNLVAGFLAPRRSDRPLRDLLSMAYRAIRHQLRVLLDRVTGQASPPVREIPAPDGSTPG